MVHRKKSESIPDYKARVMDAISPTYCGAKFYNATIWLGSGMTVSCHHPTPHKVDVEAVKQNPKALHNTPHKKKMRELMLTGKRPEECAYCWKVEDIQRDNVSDRYFKTVIYTDAENVETTKLPLDHDYDLKTLEIAFDRTCNFACSYCSPPYSTTWVKDIKKNGPYVGLTHSSYDSTHDEHQPYKYGQPNPYVEAFWKWWPDLSKSLMELRVTGGEPTMSADFWKLMDWFKENAGSSIRFAVNSNLGINDDTLTRLLEAGRSIREFDIYSSNEAYGAQAEYIRDGLDYEVWKRNAETVMGSGAIRNFTLMMTINALCLYSLTDFLDHTLEWKAQYLPRNPSWSLNILRYPNFQSALVLPDEMRAERKAAIETWFAKAKLNPNLWEHEIVQVQRLIDYLDVVKTPTYGVFDRTKMEKEFKRFYTQYDARRGKDFKAAFPMLVEWWDRIEA